MTYLPATQWAQGLFLIDTTVDCNLSRMVAHGTYPASGHSDQAKFIILKDRRRPDCQDPGNRPRKATVAGYPAILEQSGGNYS